MFEKISKNYRSGWLRGEFKAVENVTLDIRQGEIFGVIGPNGAGKSTLIKMLMGFIRPTSGKITVLGCSPDDPGIRQRIGYLPENPYYYDHLTAEELLRFSARTSGMGRKDMDERIDYLLQEMSLSHARKRKLRGYSKGMTQRAGICFALVHDPQFVILDEPMSGLDPIGRRDVVNLVLDLKKRGKTVLFCSHILNDVQKLCDRMAIMDRGKLKTVMTSEELKQRSQRVSFRCDRMTDSDADAMIRVGGKMREEDGVRHIECARTNIDAVIVELKKRDVVINDIASSDETLDTLFFETIRDKTLQ